MESNKKQHGYLFMAFMIFALAVLISIIGDPATRDYISIFLFLFSIFVVCWGDLIRVLEDIKEKLNDE